MDKIRFCKFCKTDIKKVLLYDHIIPKRHKIIENRFIMNCMTFLSDKKIKNDEWREHTNSEQHLELGKKFIVESAIKIVIIIIVMIVITRRNQEKRPKWVEGLNTFW